METLIERLESWSKPKYGLPVPARELLAEAAKEIQAKEQAPVAPALQDTVADITDDWAIELIARHAIERAATKIGEEGWEDYPELGENDWERVSHRITELVFQLGPRSYEEAAEYLGKRAGTEETIRE